MYATPSPLHAPRCVLHRQPKQRTRFCRPECMTTVDDEVFFRLALRFRCSSLFPSFAMLARSVSPPSLPPSTVAPPRDEGVPEFPEEAVKQYSGACSLVVVRRADSASSPNETVHVDQVRGVHVGLRLRASHDDGTHCDGLQSRRRRGEQANPCVEARRRRWVMLYDD